MSYAVIICIALVTAAACAYMLAPLAAAQRWTMLLFCLIVLPVAALTLYLATGQPDQPGAYAGLAKRHSERAQKRTLIARIDKLERELARQDRPAIQRRIELGTLRIEAGRFEKAVSAFEKARRMDSQHATLARKLGKACFMAGLSAMRAGQREQALQYWQKAIKSAPRDAPYRPVIKRAVQRLGTGN